MVADSTGNLRKRSVAGGSVDVDDLIKISDEGRKMDEKLDKHET